MEKRRKAEMEQAENNWRREILYCGGEEERTREMKKKEAMEEKEKEEDIQRCTSML